MNEVSISARSCIEFCVLKLFSSMTFFLSRLNSLTHPCAFPTNTKVGSLSERLIDCIPPKFS